MLKACEILQFDNTVNIEGNSLRVDSVISGKGKQGEISHLLNAEGVPSGFISKRYNAALDRDVAPLIRESFTTPEIFLGTLRDLHHAGKVNYEQCICLINAYTEAKALEVIASADTKISPIDYKGCLLIEGKDGYDVHLVMNALLMNENNIHVLAPTLDTDAIWPPDIAKFAITIAMAMSDLPDNLIHRDIKPGNILWIERGNQFIAIVIDFATARIDGEDYLEIFNLMMGNDSAGVQGSPGYMAPERMIKNAEGRTTEGLYTDTFSIGALLMKMFTKHDVDVKYDEFQKWTIRAKQRDKAQPISDTITQSSYPYLADLICSSLELNPDKRIYDRRIPLVLAGLYVNAHNSFNLQGEDRHDVTESIKKLIEFTTKIGEIGDLRGDGAVMASIMMLPGGYLQTLKEVMRAETIDQLVAKLRNGGRG